MNELLVAAILATMSVLALRAKPETRRKVWSGITKVSSKLGLWIRLFVLWFAVIVGLRKKEEGE